MKKLLLILFIVGCTKELFQNKETGCFEINKKYTGDGLYYFEWNRTKTGSATKMIIVSGAVTEEVYNQYEVGDKYCVE